MLVVIILDMCSYYNNICDKIIEMLLEFYITQDRSRMTSIYLFCIIVVFLSFYILLKKDPTLFWQHRLKNEHFFLK